MNFAFCKDNLKLVELKQNYENDHYKKSINDYFRQSRLTHAEKEKVCQTCLLCDLCKLFVSVPKILPHFARSLSTKQ